MAHFSPAWRRPAAPPAPPAARPAPIPAPPPPANDPAPAPPAPDPTPANAAKLAELRAALRRHLRHPRPRPAATRAEIRRLNAEIRAIRERVAARAARGAG